MKTGKRLHRGMPRQRRTLIRPEFLEGRPSRPAPPRQPTMKASFVAAVPPRNASDQQVEAFIRSAAGKYAATGSHASAPPDDKLGGVLIAMARRESEYHARGPEALGIVNRWDANWRRGTPSVGLFQFVEDTFHRMAARARAANPQAWEGLGANDAYDWRQQALTAAWAVANGEGWQWVTYSDARVDNGLTPSYSLALDP